DLACLAKRPDDRPSAQEATRVQHAALKDISGTEPMPVPDAFPRTRANQAECCDDWAVACPHFGRFEDALVWSNRAFALAPRDPDMLLNRGTYLNELDRPDEALTMFAAALAALPERDVRRRGLVHNDRGPTLKGPERFAEAEAAFAEAVQLVPDSGSCWHNRATSMGM